MVNDDHQVQADSTGLKNQHIALCISGSIAAIDSVKLIRQLRRHGADVSVYATAAALQFIGESALEWASTKPIITQLSGLAEHICTQDLVLLAPASINTVNKFAVGIADNPVTTLLASALGQSKPILIAPAGHLSLYQHPRFQQNLTWFEQDLPSVHLIQPRFEENKAKMADWLVIEQTVLANLSTS